MNFPPLPPRSGDDKEDVAALFEWAGAVEEFLKFPVFQGIRLAPRAVPTTADATAEGTLYQDSTANVLKAHNGTGFTDCNT